MSASYAREKKFYPMFPSSRNDVDPELKYHLEYNSGSEALRSGLMWLMQTEWDDAEWKLTLRF